MFLAKAWSNNMNTLNDLEPNSAQDFKRKFTSNVHFSKILLHLCKGTIIFVAFFMFIRQYFD
jgi:hypothetical protein